MNEAVRMLWTKTHCACMVKASRTLNDKPFAHKRGNGVSQLTVALVSVLDVLPNLLLGQGMALAGHMTRLCCGLLQHQAATVVPNATHHIQTPGSTRHYHLILCTASLHGYMYAGQRGCDRQLCV